MKRLLGNVDNTIFGGAAAIYLILFLFIILAPITAEKVINFALNYTLTNLGWLYLLGATFLLITLLILACGRFGNIKLGQPEDEPEDEPEYSFIINPADEYISYAA